MELLRLTFDETFSRGPVSGSNPGRNRLVLLSHKTVYHTAVHGGQKEDGSTQPQGRLIGYARVSTSDQDLTLQIGPLRHPPLTSNTYFVPRSAAPNPARVRR